MGSRCWNAGPDEERDELLPRKMAALQPKTEGSLRRRLLSAKLHQHHEAIWGLNAAGRPGSPLGDKKPPPPHLQYPSNSPWYRSQHRPHVHPSLPTEPHGKLILAPDACGKPRPPPPLLQLQRPTCPMLAQRRRTSSCPPTPEPRRGYTLPVPSPLMAPTPFREPEVPPQYHYRPSRGRRTGFFCFRRCKGTRSVEQPKQTTPLLHRGRSSG